MFLDCVEKSHATEYTVFLNAKDKKRVTTNKILQLKYMKNAKFFESRTTKFIPFLHDAALQLHFLKQLPRMNITIDGLIYFVIVYFVAVTKF